MHVKYLGSLCQFIANDNNLILFFICKYQRYNVRIFQAFLPSGLVGNDIFDVGAINVKQWVPEINPIHQIFLGT